ncbi:hypothetical protein SNEBB_002516 [Seison nebaliae]|nr:hypothetical protein SNEBB_002516 [Seison nebaliae]
MEDREYVNSDKGVKIRKNEDYGLPLFSERYGKKLSKREEIFSNLFSYSASRSLLRKKQCEEKVIDCLKNDPGVKLMSRALKLMGCPFNPQYHIECERCENGVLGGFDVKSNQIVVQSNKIFRNNLSKTLISSMIEAYDYCSYNYNIDNIDQVACTQIRAANLSGCHSWTDKNIFQNHADCVKENSVRSLRMIRNITQKEAEKRIDKIFPICYSRLEPFGRRIYHQRDYERAFADFQRFTLN